MSPTPELLEIVRTAMAGERPKLLPLHEPLLLRNEDRSLIDYHDTATTNQMRHELRAQNEAMAGADFGNVLPFPARLRRIFNGDFAHGGRFYAEGGAWQTLSKTERRALRIDGEPVVEIDYATFHPALAYAERGLPPPEAPYEVAGFSRDLVKVAFNILLNSSGRPGARHTIAWKPAMATHLLDVTPHRNELPSAFLRRVYQSDPSYPHRASRCAEELIEKLLARHAPIADLFFSGLGLRLQRLDSDIAEGVMRRMRRHGVVVFPIHDSFLAPASKADLIEEAMVAEAARHGMALSCSRSPFVSDDYA
ncbi:hypothetical protein [Roseitranquillus sediminis]|uniref:hypothetical protein n=1 Tax=Roseitranquillus sediminis TaxID=2809051 RepID=UPI001D0CC528|nr:hypothetical protein [Roseitranquillus sediminis]MBM9593999.1 hypothetical protein [Roseitranquillus sediminis]